MHRKIKIKWEIVITIIISIIGLYVSWQMYNIAKLQTTIAKNNISKVVSKISRPAKGRLLYYSILGGNFG